MIKYKPQKHPLNPDKDENLRLISYQSPRLKIYGLVAMLPNSSVFTIRFQALMITKRNGIRILRVHIIHNNHIYSAVCTTCIIQLFVGWTYHKYTTKNSISAVMLLAILPSDIIVVKWYLVRIVSLQFFLTCTSKSNPSACFGSRANITHVGHGNKSV